MTLMDTSLEKRLTPDGNTNFVHRAPNTPNETIELVVQAVRIFKVEVPDITLSVANALTPSEGPEHVGITGEKKCVSQ